MFNENLNNISYNSKFQICFLGDEGSGKTTTLFKMLDKDMPVLPTIGVDYHTKITKFQNKKIKFNIWDLSGSSRFRLILKNYYNDNDLIILFLDVTRDVIKSLRYWIKELKDNLKNDVPLLIVLNKSDMIESFNYNVIIELAKDNFSKFDVIYHNIKIDKYNNDYIEKKIINLLSSNMIEVDLSDKFLPKPKEKREFCLISFFKHLLK